MSGMALMSELRTLLEPQSVFQYHDALVERCDRTRFSGESRCRSGGYRDTPLWLASQEWEKTPGVAPGNAIVPMYRYDKLQAVGLRQRHPSRLFTETRKHASNGSGVVASPR